MSEAAINTTVTPTPNPGADPANPANPAPANPNQNPAPGADPAVKPGANAPANDPANPNPADPAAPKPSDKPAGAPLSGENWRQELAGDDAKALKALERIPSQKDLLKSWLEQRALISSGKHAKAPGADATPEQLKEYREANGIPETHDGYYKALPEGVTFGEDDKPGVEGFLKDMHGMNVPPAIVSKALERYVAVQEEGAIARSELDDKLKVEGT